MANQADVEDDRDEELNLDIDGDEDTQSDAGEDTQDSAEGEDQVEGGDADDEVEISFDGEAAPASKGDDSGLVKQLRAEIRKRDQLLAARPAPAPQKIEVGERPTLEACDYDEDAHATAVEAWVQRKADAEAQEAEAGKHVQAQQARFTEKLQTFAANKTALKARDFEAAEETFIASTSQAQQAIVIKAAENSAAVIYALGKHPAKLATLAAIQDPIEFTAALVKLEGKLSVTKRSKTPPEPDTPVRGSGQLSASSDKELERLEKEAERTGDRTKVVAHKRKLKAQGRS